MGTVATLRDLIEALISSAKEDGKLEKVASDMETLFKALRVDIRNILGTSVYELGEKNGVVADIGAKLGLDKLSVNFISLAIELDKFKALMKSEETFMRKIRKAAGKVRVEITMATMPSDADLDRIKEAFKGLTGKEVEAIVKIEPKILGGIIAKVENKVFDGSIKNQLERMRAALS